jgi:basic amino acid/polyamine antiporter, APA family
MPKSNAPPSLKRELDVRGAILVGLGSMVGTGVFVSIGIAAGVAGTAVILAVAIAALLAACNGLSSAQLAANHSVSGGTYEYGYRYLTPWLGFTAGWMFLLAKTASAATAALGFAGYLLNALRLDGTQWLVPLALVTVVILTLIVLGGIRRSNLTNLIIVSITLLSLMIFIITGLPHVAPENFTPFFPDKRAIAALLHGSALMFVAYSGYGRIATLGEEVHQPRRTIPIAIILTMIVTMILYMAIAAVGVGSVGVDTLSAATQSKAAPLEVASRQFGIPIVPPLLALGAMTAMVGVLLNLILGLSRVLLAMGRRRDMPRIVARLNAGGTTPYIAVICIGVAIAALVLIGNVKTTWSFSAFTVLVYYALTNLCALRLSAQERLYPKWIAGVGLAGCLVLAFWVEQQIWLVGLGLIVAGLVWKTIVLPLALGSRNH